jgi:putative ABC transport system permease protein
MFKYLKLIFESLIFALRSVIVNKLRTSLSLLGITIGIFAIISVFTIVDSLEYNIRESVSTLGSDVLYIEKWPWTEADGGDYKWWQYVNRPVPSYSEYEMLKTRSQRSQNVCFVVSTRLPVVFEKNQSDNTTIIGVSEGYEQMRSFEITSGRYLTDFEIKSGRNYAVIGSTVASRLFPNTDAVGKTITIRKAKFNVIGTLEKEGKGTFGDSMDESIIVPVNYIRNVVDIKRESMNPSIWAKASAGIDMEEYMDEIKMLMRSIRRLKPGSSDNFALNQTSMISNQLDNFFKTLNIAGWFIGVFSLLVGGFGIANIMFVSVKERTNIIGIQKALGAKKYFILFQFLFEAVMLALAGGAIGLLMVFIGTLIISGSDFAVSMRAGNIIMGIVISSAIGLISGLAPAWTASRLSPVEAINNTF